MAVTPGHEEALAPKPATVSSTSSSSLETSASVQLDFANTHQSALSVGTSDSIGEHLIQNVSYNQNLQATASSVGQLPSSISLVAGGGRLHISPSTGAVVSSSVPSTNTVPEFLYQLTKMLTDHNRDIIEWSNGKIEVHNPHKLQTLVLNRYFRHSKFASFQRQLNYFGFRKLAGKGKMAPCSYVNDATTQELGSLLLIKRKTGNEPKGKGGTKRDREDDITSEGATRSSANETSVNPVLAGIFYRSKGDSSNPIQANRATIQVGGENQQVQSRQALARVAVGKGIRHNFTMPAKKTPVTRPATLPVTPNPLVTEIPVQDSLSQLHNNFRNSLQDLATQEQSLIPQASTVEASSSTHQYIPGSLRRDDSLVDLAMIPMIEGDSTSSHPNTSTGLTFVDFPWQDPNVPSI